MSKPSLVVLAAGMGSRYGGLKQIDQVGPHGETIIDYSIFDAIQAGFGKIVFVIRRDIEEQFKEIIGKRFEAHIDVRYVFQELNALPDGFTVPEGRTKPWGTAQAILVCKEEIAEPFLVINGDDFYGSDAFLVAADYLSQAPKSEWCMVGYQLRKTLSDFGSVSRGVCYCENNKLIDINERTAIVPVGDHAEYETADGDKLALSGDSIVSMNMWGFTSEIFDILNEQFTLFLKHSGNELKSECYIPSVVDHCIKNSKATVEVLHSAAQWFGVTYQEDKEHVSSSIAKLVNDGSYPGPLFE